MSTSTPINFFDCYPTEIVSWINEFPPPDDCTDAQLNILRLIDSDQIIGIGRGMLNRLRNIEARGEADALIANFKMMIELTSTTPENC